MLSTISPLPSDSAHSKTASLIISTNIAVGAEKRLIGEFPGVQAIFIDEAKGKRDSAKQLTVSKTATISQQVL